MIAHPDHRYQCDTAATTAAKSVAFPVRVFVRKPNYAAALTAARAMIARIEKDAADLRAGAVHVEVEKIGFNHNADHKSGAGADLSCSLVLGLDPTAPLWVRSEVIVRVLDLIQTFMDESRQLKEVQVLTGRAQLRPAAAAGKPAEGGGSTG
jgi:hypothetical protein